jgi:signal transduction histidine kinase
VVDGTGSSVCNPEGVALVSRTMSIRLRFTLALSGIGLVLFGAYAVWSFRSERQDLEAAAVSELRLLGRSLETALGNSLRDRQSADIHEMLANIEVLAPKLDIHIYDPEGRLLARSSGATSDAVLEQRIQDVSRSRAESIAFEPAQSPRRLIFTAPLTADDEQLLGGVAIVRTTDDLVADLTRTRTRLFIALVAFVLGTLGAGLGLGTLYVSRPIARLVQGVRQVREGDFRARITPGRADEMGQLVEEFNAMIAALARSRERIEAESEARSRLEAGLQRVDKLVTIGELSAGVAHEIGSPLQVLSGRASTLLDHPDEEVRRQAGLLVAQCERITHVVEQLLSFGRRKSPAIVACDLLRPITSVIDLLSGEARRRGISLRLDRDAGPHEISGDPDQIQQIALNLVRNALVATPQGGSIVVSVTRRDDRVLLAVRDTGPGIDASLHERIFEPFFTTRAAEGGTGLGLAVVRAIAREHHATIEVRSSPGEGTELVVSFPVRMEV